MAFSAPIPDRLALFAGLRCSAPFCRVLTTRPGEGVCHGEAAHIEGSAWNSARHNQFQDAFVRESAENGIWLCRICHKLVDRCAAVYPTQLLHEWKQEAHDRYHYEAEHRVFKVQGDTNAYQTIDRAKAFVANHLRLANAFYDLRYRYRGWRDVLDFERLEELRMAVHHTEAWWMGPWGLERPDYVIEPETNARQVEMIRLVKSLQKLPAFRVGGFATSLDFTTTIDSSGEEHFTDLAAQALDAHQDLLSTLLPRLQHAISDPRPYAPRN